MGEAEQGCGSILLFVAMSQCSLNRKSPLIEALTINTTDDAT